MRKTIALMAVATATGSVLAGPIGGDDFDGGGMFLTRSITPDNSGNNGAFGGSIFDVFGITNRTVNFDFADDSLSIFTGDTFGVLKEGKTDNVFGVEDLDNGDNPGGGGTATWTFDISGFSDLSMAVDLAAMGDFEAGDNSYTFRYSIDGNPMTDLILIDANNDLTLDYTLEGGTVVSLDDPLVANGTILSNDFQTLSEAISGTGSVLTIEFEAGANNGGSEVFVFDNLVISGVPTPSTVALLGLGGLAAARRRRA